MSKLKRRLLRVIVALGLFFVLLVLFAFEPMKSFGEMARDWRLDTYEFYAYFLPFIAVYFIAGYDVVLKAIRNVFSGKVFDENFLMTVATFGAIVLCDLPEAVAVMLFYQVGELFQSYAVAKSRKSISALMEICPETANVIRDGEEITVFPEEVLIGDVLIVRAGEKIPVDAIVIEGDGSVDTSSLTGESVPRAFTVGDTVLSGSINLGGAIKLRAEKAYEDSTVVKILELVENSVSKKAKAENFITKFARYYTPAVVISAVVLAVLPSIFDGRWLEWTKRALTFLVVSCPCALVISVPLSFFGGIGGASAQGILIKGGNCLEALSKIGIIAFDKTGTLTKGEFEVTGVFPKDNAREILRIASIAESSSLHPMAKAIIGYAPSENIDGYTFLEIAGKGIKAEGHGELILAGSYRFMQENGVSADGVENSESAVYLAKNGVYQGYITLEDKLKDNAVEVVSKLKRQGIKTVMLTGDNEIVARKIALDIGIDEYCAGLLPQDKVAITEELKLRADGKKVCFVGDGINDAPVLTVSDVGLSMGGVGSDAAIEASDIVLMHDDLESIPKARGIAKKTMKIVRQNIIFALGVKGVVLLLSALGFGGMWIAVFADVGVAVIAILNAMRTLRANRI